MLNHIVLFKFKPSVTETEIRKIENLLDELPNIYRRQNGLPSHCIPAD